MLFSNPERSKGSPTRWYALRVRHLSIALLFTLASTLAPGQAQKPCPSQDEKRALNEREKLRTWKDVYRSFQQFSHCDDGAIAEGYSDKIVSLLARDWTNVLVLNGLARKDPRFKAFVIRHIDASADDNDLRLALQNAQRRCPAGATELCGEIVKSATEAIRVLR